LADWPHAPVHRLGEQGTFIVTAGTLHKAHHFRHPARLSLLQGHLLERAGECGWVLQAWAVFSNHYHFVAISPEDPQSLREMVRGLHYETATRINAEDGTPGRKVWFEYRDTLLTFERSYLARLNYVHQNPVKHGLVKAAAQYPWCSASWFERTAAVSFYKRVTALSTDRVNVPDEYEVEWDSTE
jgi:putative transposase